MHCFALQEAASADLKAQGAKTTLDLLKKRFFLLNDTGEPKYKLDARALEDEDIAKAEEDNFAAKALHKMMTAQVIALEHKVALFSREISRRSADQSSGGRAN